MFIRIAECSIYDSHQCTDNFQLAEEKFAGDLVGIIGDFGEFHNHVKVNKKIVKSSLQYSLEAWVVRKQKQK